MHRNKLLTRIVVLQVWLLFGVLLYKLKDIFWRRIDELGSFDVNLRRRYIDCKLIMIQGYTVAEPSKGNDSKNAEVNKSIHL